MNSLRDRRAWPILLTFGFVAALARVYVVRGPGMDAGMSKMIVATVSGLGSAGSITTFVATKLRSSTRKQDPPKTDRLTLSVEMRPNQLRYET